MYLISIKLGETVRGATRGTRNDWSHIASAISQCKHLIRLNLNQNLLRDSDMEVLLSSLPNLKVLLLCGPIDSKGGHLTDKSCKIISKACPELRGFDLCYHRKITITGIKRILKNCQHLRNIRMSLVVSQTDAISMHNLAPSLIYISFMFGFDEASYGELIRPQKGVSCLVML